MNPVARLWNAVTSRLRPTGQTFVYRKAAGALVTPETALGYAAVWACVRVISESIAALPWRVHRLAGSGSEPFPDHPVDWLLHFSPNGEQTSFTFRETLVSHLLIWGNAYAEIVRDLGGRPTALWLIEPHRVQVQRPESGALEYLVSNEAASQTRLAAENVLHWRGLSPDGVTGYSPVAMAARSIGVGIAQDEFAASYYGNGTMVGGVLKVPGSLSAEQIKQAESHFNAKHRGPANAFNVRIAHAGMEYTPTPIPMTDAQFLESRKFSVQEIARWFRVPPHKLADLERATFSNVEHLDIEFARDTLTPWALRLEQEVNLKLFGRNTQGKVYSRLNLNGVMRGDSKARSEFYKSMATLGVMSVNEIRALEDMNGIGDAGDQHLVQINQTTLERIGEEPAPAAAGAPAPDPEPADPAGDDAQLMAQIPQFLKGTR